MSFGRLQASAFAAAQETTLALANINFDFSLYKVEAPAEYQGLGKVISARRREAAESGAEHIFARRLGALFSQDLPATPHLFKAYGARASEIAQSPQVNPQGSREDGIFQEWIGADATSIWAAATSGSGAIAVHLLACMLARLWSPAEATAIWDEIIARRREVVLNLDPADPLHIGAFMASKADINREQMASWDASARSWLAMADLAKSREQTQLVLLIQKASLSVINSSDVYGSVMKAWKDAMTTVDKIIAGMPHQVEDTAVLLGLISWHLYPDLYVLQANSKHISNKDKLVHRGGVVTLGASSHSPDNDSGISWSLPLSYLKFYGDPIVSCSDTVATGISRLSFIDFSVVVLGAVIAGWDEVVDDFEEPCQLIVRLSDCIDRWSSLPPRSSSWLKYLSEAAELYLSSEGTHKAYLHNLISRGKKRHGTFLAPKSNTPEHIFGLESLQDLLTLTVSTEDRISMLRLIVKEKHFKLRSDELIIRYTNDRDMSKTAHWPGFSSDYLANTGLTWEYATAVPCAKMTKKRKIQDVNTSPKCHVRWHQPGIFHEKGSKSSVPPDEEVRSALGVLVNEDGLDSFQWNCEALNPDWVDFYNRLPTSGDLDGGNHQHIPEFGGTLWYSRLVGAEPFEPAVYVASGVKAWFSKNVTCSLLNSALGKKLINPGRLLDHLEKIGNSFTIYTKSLMAVAAAGAVYKLMPRATITTGIFTKSLKDALWVQDLRQLNFRRFAEEDEDLVDDMIDSLTTGSIGMPTAVIGQSALRVKKRRTAELPTFFINRHQAFACIAMFENSKVNLDPKSLDTAMAITAGNSIYVAMELTCDPFEKPTSHEVQHLIGNIGRPGVNILIPPPEPKILRHDEDEWRIISRRPFDGNSQDAFQHTSLHLSFTRYQLPIGVASHGDQAREAYFQETLISIRDRGQWIADLDVLGGLGRDLLGRAAKDCSHDEFLKKTLLCEFLAIDSWDEFIDEPPKAAVFSTKGNLQARLAATVLSVQSGYPTVLCATSEPFCHACAQHHLMKRIENSPGNNKPLILVA